MSTCYCDACVGDDVERLKEANAKLREENEDLENRLAKGVELITRGLSLLKEARTENVAYSDALTLVLESACRPCYEHFALVLRKTAVEVTASPLKRERHS